MTMNSQPFAQERFAHLRHRLRLAGGWVDALENPARHRLYDAVKADPGINFRALSRATGLAGGTTRHHLTKLVRSGHLAELGFRCSRRFFPNEAKYAQDWETRVVLRESPLKELHDWVQANPGRPQRGVLDAMAARGWSRSTTQHRLGRLVDRQVLQVRFQGRYMLYWTAAAAVVMPGLTCNPTPAPEAPVDIQA